MLRNEYVSNNFELLILFNISKIKKYINSTKITYNMFDMKPAVFKIFLTCFGFLVVELSVDELAMKMNRLHWRQNRGKQAKLTVYIYGISTGSHKKYIANLLVGNNARYWASVDKSCISLLLIDLDGCLDVHWWIWCFSRNIVYIIMSFWGWYFVWIALFT